VLQLVAKRLLATIPTLFRCPGCRILLLNVVPAIPSPRGSGTGDSATIARLRGELHLDSAIPAQFEPLSLGRRPRRPGSFLHHAASVLGDLAERFPKTLQLAAAAWLLAVTCGITLGVSPRSARAG